MRTRSRERGSRFSFPLFGSVPAGMLSDAYRQKRGIFAIFPHYLLYIHIASKNMRYDENGMRCAAGVCLSNACATACQRILLRQCRTKIVRRRRALRRSLLRQQTALLRLKTLYFFTVQFTHRLSRNMQAGEAPAASPAEHPVYRRGGPLRYLHQDTIKAGFSQRSSRRNCPSYFCEFRQKSCAA